MIKKLTTSNKIKIIIFAICFALIFTFFSFTVFADEHDKKIVKVGYYENENFQEGASDGLTKSGYAYEYLQKIASYNGWKYEYVYGSWSEMYAALLKGDIDILCGLGYADERLDVLNYSNYPMGYENYYLYIHDDDNSTVKDDASTLNGKKIGTISGLMEDSLLEWLSDNNISAEIVVFDDVHLRDQALIDKKIDAFIGEGVSVSSKGNIIPLIKIKNVDMYICLSKNRLDLLEDLDLAQENLDNKEPYYLNELSKKYFSKNAISLQVAAEEAAWLDMHDYTIKIGYLDNYLPFCGTDENGNATGIMVDVINEAFSNIKALKPIKFEYLPYRSTEEMIDAVHSHNIEMMFPISNDIYFLEQSNLYHSSDVITSAINLVYFGNPSKLGQGIFAINKNNQVQENYVLNYFPNNKILYFDTIEECLDAVADGKATETVVSGIRTSYLLKRDKYSNLSYLELPHDSAKCFGVSTTHKGILPLINQALNSIEENSAINYSFKYVDYSEDYSVAEFFRRHKWQTLFVIMLLIAIAAIVVANDRIKTQKRNLYYEFAYKDGLTKLLNRRAYEEELEKLNNNIPENLICVSMDLTRLKYVNDNYGHAAGDELITEAARLITEAFGKLGKIYRTGGDEYYGLLQADISEFKAAKENLDELCKSWKGKYSNSLKIAVGAASLKDVDSKDILEVCKFADKCMYEDKADWYNSTGIQRRVN